MHTGAEREVRVGRRDRRPSRRRASKTAGSRLAAPSSTATFWPCSTTTPPPPRRPRSRSARTAAAPSRSAASPRRWRPGRRPGRSPREQHGDQPVAEDVDRGLVAGVEQQHHGGDHLVLAQVGGRQVADQVVTRAAAAARPTSSRTSSANSPAARPPRPRPRRSAPLRTSARSPATSRRRSARSAGRDAEELRDHQDRQRLGVLADHVEAGRVGVGRAARRRAP